MKTDVHNLWKASGSTNYIFRGQGIGKQENRSKARLKAFLSLHQIGAFFDNAKRYKGLP